MENEQKMPIKTINVEFVDNGFIVERCGYNPLGPDLREKRVIEDIGEVVSLLVDSHSQNLWIRDKTGTTSNNAPKLGIVILERSDGSKQIIAGRHKFEVARDNCEKSIKGSVVEEGEV